MQIIKETRRRGTRKDLNGPRTNSEEPNLSGRDAIGLKHPNPTPFPIGTPLKSGSEHRPATKPKLFKPTLYKSYCEGSFVYEPKNINGPQRNRVLTFSLKKYKIKKFFFFFLPNGGRTCPRPLLVNKHLKKKLDSRKINQH